MNTIATPDDGEGRGRAEYRTYGPLHVVAVIATIGPNKSKRMGSVNVYVIWKMVVVRRSSRRVVRKI
jgi:hypothetical protein